MTLLRLLAPLCRARRRGRRSWRAMFGPQKRRTGRTRRKSARLFAWIALAGLAALFSFHCAATRGAVEAIVRYTDE